MANHNHIIPGTERERAKYAYECVDKVKKEEYNQAYKSHVKKIPAYIQTNGLGATLTFIYGKGKKDKAFKKIYEHIEKYKPIKNWLQDKELLAAIANVEDSTTYRAVTNEVLALVNWLKRFADGLIED